MSLYCHCLHCSVCKEDFNLRESWLNHLARGNHQNRARLKSARWKKDERECVIVAFSNVSMANSESLLRYFCKDDVNTIVTDFVWWPERPRVGLLQFESGNMVQEVLNRMGKLELQLEDCFVHLKKGVDYLDYEWNELIIQSPSILNVIEESELSENAVARSIKLERMEFCSLEDTEPELSNQIHEEVEDNSTNLNATEVLKEFSGDSSSISKDLLLQSCKFNFVTCTPPAAYSSLWIDFISQLQGLCKLVEIPEDEFQEALTVMENVTKIVGDQYEVTMYRNWYLKLRSTGSSILLLFVYKKNRAGDPESSQFLRARVSDQTRPEENCIFENNSAIQFLPDYRWTHVNQKKASFFGSLFVNPVTNFRLAVSTNPLLIMETQMCRLVKYLSSFDPRFKPVLSLIFAWAKTNRVHLAELRLHKTVQCSNVPEPAALEWLVILFFCKSGIFPTPREIQQRPHKPLEIFKNRKDIGFEADPKFVEEWRSNSKSVWKECPEEDLIGFSRSVLTLVKDFFELYSDLLTYGEWVLNTRDGEIYSRHDFLNEEPGTIWSTRLTGQEIYYLRKLASKQPVMDKIYVIHPLYLTWRLSFCCDETMLNSNYKNIKNAKKRLKKLLQECEDQMEERIDLGARLLGKTGLKVKNRGINRKSIVSQIQQRYAKYLESKRKKDNTEKTAVSKNAKLSKETKNKISNIRRNHIAP